MRAKAYERNGRPIAYLMRVASAFPQAYGSASLAVWACADAAALDRANELAA